MKKKGKGRLAGTIGWILAVVLCLGTVGYGTYKCVDGVLGSTTGSSVLARFNVDAMAQAEDETKYLLSETAMTYAASTEEAAYTSYTMEYSASATLLFDTAVSLGDESEALVTAVSTTLNGVFKVTNDYVYEKVNTWMAFDSEVVSTVVESYYVKETGVAYTRTNTFAGEGANDSLLLDSASWVQGGVAVPLESVDDMGGLENYVPAANSGAQAIYSFMPLLTEELAFNLISGEFTYAPEYSQEYMEENGFTELSERYGFTAGMRPTFFCSKTIGKASEDSGEGYSSSIYMKVTTNEVLVYSNLNNTKVELPKSLVDFIASEAEVA